MIDPIIDRNILDVNYAKELALKIQKYGYNSFTELEKKQWNLGLKGFINYTDMNRIEKNTQELAEIFELEISDPKMNWNMGTIPTQKDFQRMRDNVQKIRSSGWSRKSTPSTPALPLNTYSKINDIEKIILDAYLLYRTPTDSTIYVGEIYADELIGDL